MVTHVKRVATHFVENNDQSNRIWLRLFKALVSPILTTKIDDREMFMKGINYSYYYEQYDWYLKSKF